MSVAQRFDRIFYTIADQGVQWMRSENFRDEFWYWGHKGNKSAT